MEKRSAPPTAKTSRATIVLLVGLALMIHGLLMDLELAPHVHASNIVQPGGATPSGFYLVSGGISYCGDLFQICTPASGLTILNSVPPAGSAMISAGGTQILKAAAGAGAGITAVFGGASISAGNTSLTVALKCLPQPSGNSTSPLCGVVFGESGVKMIGVYSLYNYNAASGMQVVYFSNLTTPAGLGTVNLFQPGASSGIWWVKLTCSVPGCASGTIKVQVSSGDGQFSAGYFENVNAHFTVAPNQWGVIASSSSTTEEMDADILSFKVLP